MLAIVRFFSLFIYRIHGQKNDEFKINLHSRDFIKPFSYKCKVRVKVNNLDHTFFICIIDNIRSHRTIYLVFAFVIEIGLHEVNRIWLHFFEKHITPVSYDQYNYLNTKISTYLQLSISLIIFFNGSQSYFKDDNNSTRNSKIT